MKCSSLFLRRGARTFAAVVIGFALPLAASDGAAASELLVV